MSKPDLSVIIVNWNTCEYLRVCLHSLERQRKDLSIEVWVVDNASSDCSLTMLTSGSPWVRVIANSENQGFAAANNQALCKASGRYVMLLNPDTEVGESALVQMIEFLESHPEAGIVGPQLTLANGRPQGGAAGYDPSLVTVFNYSFLLYRLSLRWFRGMWLARSRYHIPSPVEVDWVSGAALMFRRSVYEQVGDLNESYFMYAEDVEWCARVRQAGWRVFCLPTARIVHHIGRSTRQRGPAFFAANVDNLDQYYRSRYSAATVALLHLFGVGGFLIRTLGYAFFYILWRRGVHKELRDQRWVCVKTSLARIFGPPPHVGRSQREMLS